MPRAQDSSNRIYHGTLATARPYIYLGFDQLMQSRKVFERWKTLDDVTSLECAAHMGRPLWGTRYDHGDDEVRRTLLDFAAEKLLCGKSQTYSDHQTYALLSQRLALDTNTPQYLLHPAQPFEAVKNMHEQIARHMRVCMAIGKGIESVRGIAPSEPILSEAASRVMISDTFSLPDSLSKVLSGYCISQGDRGELIVAAFFTWARDQVVKNKAGVPTDRLCPYFSVLELFQHLFSESAYTSMHHDTPSLCHTKDTSEQFGEVFQKARMHFNHVIKPQDQKTLARPYLLHFLARGAAALGANGQPGFDAVYPFLYDSLDLDIKKVSFIIVQVKNDSNVYRSLDDLFWKMDPFHCGLLHDSDKEDGRFPVPIIRIVFLLTGSIPSFAKRTYSSLSEGTVTLKDGQPLFTSYDYVCEGIDPGVLSPLDHSPDLWKALLNKRDNWDSFYEVVAPDVLRSQLPAQASHSAHYTSWSDAVSLFHRDP